jgi:spore maturation protein CgeB
MASGSVLLTNYFSGLELLFPPEAYCLYNDTDIVEKATQILNDQEYAQHIVDAGLKTIHDRHTNQIRTKQLFDILEKL